MQLDEDKSGSISFANLKRVANELVLPARFCLLLFSYYGGISHSSFLFQGEVIPDEELRAMIEEFDRNNTGHIDFTDFSKIMSNNPTKD